ncbi:hypothetical protein BAE44_0005851 [Dichanthelium oligosanthes]|uniref:Protein CPR-5 n=1 Tax=Dichanthelium oligosanthes TaxID=888268 RepID=A0A1E5W6U1_9POAL|nr:hypothetical protein BAE44_0005851 [Dichanthelium oligosanthes]
MDGAHTAAGSGSSEAGGASSSASSASSYGFSDSRLRLHKGVHLRRRRVSARVGGSNKGSAGDGDGDLQDLALPLGMSFAAVLAQVRRILLGLFLFLFEIFMRNFEKSFGSTFRTLRLINEASVYEKDMPQHCYKDGNSVPEIKLSGADSQSRIHDVQEETPLSSTDSQIILHAVVNHQLVHHTRSRATPGIGQQVISVFERSLNEQARSNDLKELEIGLTMREIQLKQSQLALGSDSHKLEKVKVCMGFKKLSFKEEKLKTQMEDTRHAELLRKLIDMLLTAVVLMSVCFGYGTYIYSYQRITAVTSACAAASRRSGMTGPSMPITFNVMLLGVLCGWFGRTKGVHSPYWARRYAFYVLVSLILPCLAGLLPFASLSDWIEPAIQYVKYSGSNIED